MTLPVSLTGVTTYVKIQGGRGEYSVKDRAIGFLGKIDGGLTCDGFVSKFDIDSNGNALSKYLQKQGEEPKPVSICESQILETIKNFSVG